MTSLFAQLHQSDRPVDEVRDRLRFVPALAQPLGHRREGRHALGERRVSPGRGRSGSENAHFSRSRVEQTA